MTLIELDNITRTYPMGGEPVRALRGVSLKIEAGEFVAIMGASGSGKSSLLQILGLLDKPDSGSYRLLGKDVSRLSEDELSVIRNHSAGFVFQQFHLLKRSTAIENVQLPLIYAGIKNNKDKALARLNDVGLSSRARHKPNELSGGEQQRVAIARALVNDPPILFADEPTGNLDTKSEEEILKILIELNQKGKTIIMVTHEREIAQHAKRIIIMRDGSIISDDRLVQHVKISSSTDHYSTQENQKGAGWSDHTQEAMRAILANKMRSMLSMLGILIGVGAVIAMLALGEGAKEAIAQRLASMGSNLLTVRPGSAQTRGVALEAGAVTRFTLQDAQAISKLEDIKSTSASVRGRAQVVFADKNWNTQVQGVGIDYEPMRASTPTSGRFFTPEELRSRERVALLGTTVAAELFASDDPVGQNIKVNRSNFKIIGVLPRKGSGGWNDDDDVIVIPITTAMYRLLGKQYVDFIDAEAKDAESIETAEKAIQKLVISRKRLTGQQQDTFQIRNMAQVQETLQSTTQTMTALLGSIAAISLLVGGIGIMNIMLVSVTERTKEIGLRKAIGARRSDIVRQFLIEAIMMTIAGGLMGILLGSFTAWMLSLLAGWSTKISLYSLVLASSFSVIIGIIFGLWPAKKAADLNPIAALRYE